MNKRMVCAAIAGLVGVLAATSVLAAAAQPGEQLRFATPEEALKALAEATKNKDLPQLRKIFDVEPGELGSGDKVQDEADLAQFAKDLAAAAKLEPDGDDKMTLVIGPQRYEFPVPLIRKDGRWYFDTPAGLEEMLNRRIGENELGAVAACRGYIEAQRDYYAQDWDGNGVIEYAQRMASTPGKKDGLYWETKDDEPPSPLGPLVAEAQLEGYGKATTQPAATQPTTQPTGPRPYHGYYFKILTKQGARAPGGKYDYVINGHMVGGFALVAWPVNWEKSGVMTFLVNTNGKLYQKNLGEKTAEIVKGIVEYDPDDTWAPVED